jgi:glycosyltransferase involved in cell wall biosynthesis
MRQRILILTDGLGWIVDQITDEMIKRIPFDFTKDYYTRISDEELIEKSKGYDLVHYQNCDLVNHPRILEVKNLLVSCRSHRMKDQFRKVYGKVPTHVITPELKEEFPESHYISDGIFDRFKPDHEFIVGFAGRHDEYKGFRLIEKACDDLGVMFNPAEGIKPEDMPDYYRSIDLYVCASENEGHSTPVMECLAMNVPVLTTNVGIPKGLNVHKADRTVESLKEGIEKFYTQNQVKDFNWENICVKFKELYEEIKSGRGTTA